MTLERHSSCGEEQKLKASPVMLGLVVCRPEGRKLLKSHREASRTPT